MRLILSWVTIAVGLVSATLEDDFKTSCLDLSRSLVIPNTTLNLVEYVSKSTKLLFPDNDASCNRPSQGVTVDLCRVALYVTTSSSSGINLEAWLPRNWTGRYLSTGNGGLGGCIQYEDMSYGATHGFAVVGTNNGHNGTSGMAFVNNPGVLEDYSHRSVHVGAVVGKLITATFYSRNHTKAYYLGCSTGGRQGFQSAQMHPSDFDGIIAGSPTLAFTQLTGWAGWLGLLTGYNKTDPGFVSQRLWEVIHDEILRQCDEIDGAIDGIIEDPDFCHPNLEDLHCRGDSDLDCLNPEQLRRAQGVFAPFLYTNNTVIFPRMQPGSELKSSSTFYSGNKSSYVYEWFRAIYSNPEWDAASFTLSDLSYAQELNPFGVNTWNGNLSAFRDAGGKLLHYHGLQDYLISSDNSARYYNFVSQTMALEPVELDEFYRYFRIAGMGHCMNGPGAWMIGQTSVGSASDDPESNVLMRMVEWVEKDQAPNTIRGVKYHDDTAEQGIAFSRMHCKYPEHNMHLGLGPATNESSWACVI